MECNLLADVLAHAGSTSGLLAMASGNRNLLKFIGRCVPVSRLPEVVACNQSITVAESRGWPTLLPSRFSERRAARPFTDGVLKAR